MDAENDGSSATAAAPEGAGTLIPELVQTVSPGSCLLSACSCPELVLRLPVALQSTWCLRPGCMSWFPLLTWCFWTISEWKLLHPDTFLGSLAVYVTQIPFFTQQPSVILSHFSVQLCRCSAAGSPDDDRSSCCMLGTELSIRGCTHVLALPDWQLQADSLRCSLTASKTASQNEGHRLRMQDMNSGWRT